MLRTCCLILSLVAGSRQLKIPTFIVPNQVELGENAEIQCQYTLDETDVIEPYLKWWWTPIYTTDQDEKQLFQRIGNDSSVIRSFVEHKGDNTLLIKNIDYSHSGIYECEVSGITEIRLRHELIVFSKGSGPQLNITEVVDDDNQDKILLECEAENVTPLPELALTVNSVTIENVTTHLVNDSVGLYNISVQAMVDKEEVNGAMVQCELFYINRNVTHRPFIAEQLYDPSSAATVATEPLEVAQEATQPASQSLNDKSSDCRGLQASGILLVLAVIPMYLRIPL